MAKRAYCWCGKPLIEGVTREGEWFSFGFLSCTDHMCWYESEKEWTSHLADEFKKAGTPQHTTWGSVLY